MSENGELRIEIERWKGASMPQINSFRDLRVYKSALRESRAVFVTTCSFPKDERYSLTDQIRRSSRAVGAMIAEAWAKRRYPAAFVAKLDDALGEAMETQAWLDHSMVCEYIDAEHHRRLDVPWQQIGGMLMKMMQKVDYFCPPTKRT